jgi:predicted S18 family serine protease
VQNGIQLILDNRDDHRYYRTELYETFTALLQTPPLLEIAIGEAKQLKLIKEQQTSRAKKRSSNKTAVYDLEECINNIIEFIFLSYGKLHEWNEAISYWHKHYEESDLEIKLFHILNLLETYNRTEEWQQAYNNAVKSGIQPGDKLKMRYTFLQEHGRLPTQDERIEILNRRLEL